MTDNTGMCQSICNPNLMSSESLAHSLYNRNFLINTMGNDKMFVNETFLSPKLNR